MKTVNLECYHYDEEDYCDKVTTFCVPKLWLMKYLELDSDVKLNEFLEEYCSEDTEQIYSQALLEGVITEEVVFC